MELKKIDDVIAQALDWHKQSGTGPVGITFVYEGRVLHWMEGERLPNPKAFAEGVFAVHHDGVAWEAFGVFDEHDDESGALGWRRAWGSEAASRRAQ